MMSDGLYAGTRVPGADCPFTLLELPVAMRHPVTISSVLPLAFIVMGFFLLGATGCSDAAGPASGEQGGAGAPPAGASPDSEEIRLRIPSMFCENCSGAVTRVVQGFDGATVENVDLETKWVTIQAPQGNRERIVAELNRQRWAVEEVAGEAEAREDAPPSE